MLIIRDVRDIINEDTESFCSYKSWTTYTEQESDLRSNSCWCDVDDEKDEDLKVSPAVKLPPLLIMTLINYKAEPNLHGFVLITKETKVT